MLLGVRMNPTRGDLLQRVEQLALAAFTAFSLFRRTRGASCAPAVVHRSMAISVTPAMPVSMLTLNAVEGGDPSLSDFVGFPPPAMLAVLRQRQYHR